MRRTWPAVRHVVQTGQQFVFRQFAFLFSSFLICSNVTYPKKKTFLRVVFVLNTSAYLSGLASHPPSHGSCGSESMGSCWRCLVSLVFSLWWWFCCWAATSTLSPSTAPPGSSCHVTGSRTWRTVETRRTPLIAESSATCGISSASAGRWCGSRCTAGTETPQIPYDLQPDSRKSELHFLKFEYQNMIS